MRFAIIEYQYYSERDNGLLDALHKQVDVSFKHILITNQIQENIEANTIILNHTNKGKDIGAKLIGLDFILSLQEDYDLLFFVHDKKSPHSPLGNIWYKELTKIFREPFLKILKKEMEKDRVGICCSYKYIKNEFNRKERNFFSHNNNLLKQLVKDYDLNPPSPYYFVAGTIFCCKWSPVKEFFSEYNPLTIRKTLERGNVQDVEKSSNTHAWERMLSWIITSKGYTIKGI